MSSQPFCWSSVINTSFLLNFEFFVGDGKNKETLVPKKAQDPKRPTALEYSLDVLNKSKKVGFVDSSMNEYTLYISAYTDQYSKVFEISDSPSLNIFETEKDKKLRKKRKEESKALKALKNDKQQVAAKEKEETAQEDLNVKEDLIVKEDLNVKESRIHINMRQLNISLISPQNEVLTLVLDRWNSIVSTTKEEFIYEATLGRLQIDNHG